MIYIKFYTLTNDRIPYYYILAIHRLNRALCPLISHVTFGYACYFHSGPFYLQTSSFYILTPTTSSLLITI